MDSRIQDCLRFPYIGQKITKFYGRFHGGDELLIMQIVVQKRKGITPHSLLMKGALYFTLVRGVKRLAAHLPIPVLRERRVLSLPAQSTTWLHDPLTEPGMGLRKGR